MENEQKIEVIEIKLPTKMIYDRIMDAFITAEYQDENWKDEDTARLIIQKLTGESPLEYVNQKR